MGYQTGTTGPIPYSQHNSGINTDTDSPISCTPEEFGVSPGVSTAVGSVR
jgi:hypothetical protein